MATVAVVILNWNGKNLTEQCVRSVLTSTYHTVAMYVLDNGSTNNEADYLQQQFGERVTVWRSDTNLGFAGGNNFVFKKLLPHSDIRYVLLLNQDSTVSPECIKTLVQYSETHPKVAVVGPTVFYSQTTTIQSCGARINWWTGKVIALQHGEPYQTGQLPQRVDCVIGNCWLVKTDSLRQLGLFDERYFAYYEEVAWCVQAIRRGWQCAVVPQAIAYHAKTSGFRTYWNVRNMIWFEITYATMFQRCVFAVYFWCKFWPERLLKGSPLKELWRASVDGWRG